ANLRPDNDIIPPGVFITESIIGSKTYPSVTNIGCCPTFNKDRTHIESYIMGLQTDLYDKRMALLILKKIRDEKTFDSPEQLQRQIEKDIRITEQYFTKQKKH
ncbi:MAG TPA: bifunctional riboflavin kinase/FMN adenylyltransferase, partial [Candidatus Aminicenantes bacterium]|nr:bifunctional riboflavin kinase/FMN adenylyltransferase [Candidatus Aminicenantes bacterium]